MNPAPVSAPATSLEPAATARLKVCVIGLGGGGFHWEAQKVIQNVRRPLDLVLVYAGPGGGLMYWHSKDEVVAKYIVRSPALTGDNYPKKAARLLHNLWQAISILAQEKPDVVLSVGTAQAVPFGIAARLLRIRHLFAESVTRARHPSRTARMVHRLGLSSKFYYYWTELEQYFDRGTCMERDRQ